MFSLGHDHQTASSASDAYRRFFRADSARQDGGQRPAPRDGHLPADIPVALPQADGEP